MELLSKKDFYELSEQHSGSNISIYLPTHKSGVAVNEKQDQIVFKNLVQQTAQELKQRGHELPAIERLLQPAYDLIEDKEFWNSMSEGLAVFLANDFFKIIKIPYTVNQELHINSSFNVSQLTQMVTNNRHFYLLVISKNKTRFLKGDSYSIEELEVPGLPYGIDDVIHFEEKSERKLFRGGGTQSGVAASFHGHSNGLADEDEYILQYMKEVDQTLWTEVLANEKAPLLLAGVDAIVATYKSASKYKHIVDDYISGNHDQTNKNALLKKATELVKPFFEEQCNQALKNYYNNLAGQFTSSIPEKIIPASYYAQVSDLFVEKNTHIWGNFDEENNKLTVHTEKQPDDECLVNKAIVKTMMNGGGVYVLEKEKMPKESVMAAFLRFNT
ncbi:hypothetical protein [Pseudopedobacter sp.]|uniref:baeRF7 domain-containing protein n=1 Tax=Pseudopedobacter sp. TaxID=1936787 RepID=UPI0033411C3D